jgi:osmotically-inducible protein OsmY
MERLRGGMSIAGAVLLLTMFPACKRAPGDGVNSSDNAVREDMKEVGKTTEKAAKDIGHAAVGAADRAGEGVSEAGDRVAAGSQDGWITTKVKSELASKGFDPLRVHVDTDRKVVTLSGTVESAAEREKAVALARAVKDVAKVTDHLFVGPARR